MKTITFRFNDSDMVRLDLLKNRLHQQWGINTNIGVIRYLLAQATLKDDVKVNIKDVEVNRSKQKLSEKGQSIYDEYVNNPDKSCMCEGHAFRPIKECGCLQNGNLVKTLLDRGY